jgi:hypothetical protein
VIISGARFFIACPLFLRLRGRSQYFFWTGGVHATFSRMLCIAAILFRVRNSWRILCPMENVLPPTLPNTFCLLTHYIFVFCAANPSLFVHSNDVYMCWAWKEYIYIYIYIFLRGIQQVHLPILCDVFVSQCAILRRMEAFDSHYFPFWIYLCALLLFLFSQYFLFCGMPHGNTFCVAGCQIATLCRFSHRTDYKTLISKWFIAWVVSVSLHL